MKIKHIFKIFTTLFVTLIMYGCSPKPFVDSQNNFNPADAILDTFNSQNPSVDCPAYRDLKIAEYFGHCIYYDNASIQVSPSTNGNNIIVEYDLQPIYEWGNWFSIRRTTSAPYDLSSYSGIKLRMRIVKPADAILRITIADIDPKTAPYASDELWWCDFQNLTTDPAGEWKILVCPFNSFTVSNGFGARQNDQKLDLQNIIAFEISVLSRTKARINGSLEIDSLAAYK